MSNFNKKKTYSCEILLDFQGPTINELKIFDFKIYIGICEKSGCEKYLKIEGIFFRDRRMFESVFMRISIQ